MILNRNIYYYYVPNLRFGEFSSPYKQLKLNDCLSRVYKPVNTIEEEIYYQIGIRSHGKGLFYKDPETGKEIGNKRIFWIVPNCLIVNIVFAWERAVAKTTEKEIGMVASHRFPIYRVNKSSLDYILQYLKTSKGEQLLKMASPGGAGRNKTLNQEDFLNSKIYLPCIKEQEKVSKLIDMLEDRIVTQSFKIINDYSLLKNSNYTSNFLNEVPQN